MRASEDIRKLETELEEHTRDLREDAAQISDKIEETKERLSPRNIIAHRPVLASLGALLLGFIFGYLVNRRKASTETIAAVKDAGKSSGGGILAGLGQNVAWPLRRL
jgi:phosphohistidine phosphatase SixA